MAEKQKKGDSDRGCGCIIYETIIGLIAFIIVGISSGGFSFDYSFWMQCAKWKMYLMITPFVLIAVCFILYLLWEKIFKKSEKE